MTRAASALDSTNTQRPAPRESASIPIAPEPAKRSSTVASSTGPIRLNAASLTRSDVGLVATPRGAAIPCPFREPAMIRTPLGLPEMLRLAEQSVDTSFEQSLAVERPGDLAGTLEKIAVASQVREAEVGEP
jgi:hypothetical protein